MQLAPDSPLIPSAKMISESASKGATMIRQLLSFTTVTAAAPRRPVDLGSLLRESVELYRGMLGERVKFSIELPERPAVVLSDQNQLQQIFSNLLVNAREATESKPDPEVAIRVRRVRVRAGEIDPELPPGMYLRIMVEDNGQGMDREQRTRCFEPFFTTKNIDSRTGVGLSGSGIVAVASLYICRNTQSLSVMRSKTAPKRGKHSLGY
jgi:signal transduction histidine kinase